MSDCSFRRSRWHQRGIGRRRHQGYGPVRDQRKHEHERQEHCDDWNSTAEFEQEFDSHGAFARLDTNHDGKLSAAEAAADPKVQAMWKKLDANNDGTVSEAEFAAHQAELK